MIRTFITTEWRLKLLAVGLAVLMLGALAFSQNQPTTKSLTVGLNYAYPPNIVLIDPPAKTTVTYSGLADVISHVNEANLIASVDATHAAPGTAVSDLQALEKNHDLYADFDLLDDLEVQHDVQANP